VSNPRRPLRLNVGLLVTAAIGTSRDFTFDYDKMRLGEDLTVKEFKGTARFNRTPQGLLLQGDFNANLDLECVRCLEGYQQAITWSITDLYAFDKRSISESDLLVPEDGQIDLSPLLREYALLEVPIQPVCRPNCKGLCPECGENRNRVDCGHTGSSSESPFTALKDLLD
jgi:DUF177 domain-containing protein